MLVSVINSGQQVITDNIIIIIFFFVAEHSQPHTQSITFTDESTSQQSRLSPATQTHFSLPVSMVQVVIVVVVVVRMILMIFSTVRRY